MSLPTLPTETTWGGILFLALVAMFLSSERVGAFQTEIKEHSSKVYEDIIQKYDKRLAQ